MATVQLETSPQIERYLQSLRNTLHPVPTEEREWLLQQARARLDLTLELEGAAVSDETAVERALARLGSPETLAEKLRSEAPPSPLRPEGRLIACRSCREGVSTEALSCPHCGAPHPAQQNWGGRGYEWKSKATLFGYPVVHVAFGRDEKGKLRVAKGVIAIGQFGIGAITVAQFGVGFLFGLGQFMLAPLALGQFAIGLAAAGQFGIGLLFGAGQFATGLKAYGMLTFGNWLGK